MYCGKGNQDAEIYFCLLLPSLTPNVIYREICVKDFSGTVSRIVPSQFVKLCVPGQLAKNAHNS